MADDLESLLSELESTSASLKKKPKRIARPKPKPKPVVKRRPKKTVKRVVKPVAKKVVVRRKVASVVVKKPAPEVEATMAVLKQRGKKERVIEADSAEQIVSGKHMVAVIKKTKVEVPSAKKSSKEKKGKGFDWTILLPPGIRANIREGRVNKVNKSKVKRSVEYRKMRAQAARREDAAAEKRRTIAPKTILRGGKGRVVGTKIDEMLGIVKNDEGITIEDLALKIKLGETRIELWANLLEEQGLIDIYYPAVGSPELRFRKY